MSWVPQAKDSPIGIVIGNIVEPYLSIFRRFIPPIGMIDFSPIVAIFALKFVQIGLLTVWFWIVSLI
ncbi:YggT family protein [Shimazuella soli]|uniref:YggT family protein n=1 Tax=Shimazuella soli TaxID=1892854 RepID=UPI0030B80836